MSKKNNKRIDHVQKGLKADTLWDDRPIKEASELANLIGDQFDDMTTFKIKQEKVCLSLI
jgi:hypothetical protein|tara:strand:- start:409 stop:588 length:180 start_codon:yes stop_codon:yes gene_type:complete